MSRPLHESNQPARAVLFSPFCHIFICECYSRWEKWRRGKWKVSQPCRHWAQETAQTWTWWEAFAVAQTATPLHGSSIYLAHLPAFSSCPTPFLHENFSLEIPGVSDSAPLPSHSTAPWGPVDIWVPQGELMVGSQPKLAFILWLGAPQQSVTNNNTCLWDCADLLGNCKCFSRALTDLPSHTGGYENAVLASLFKE